MMSNVVPLRDDDGDFKRIDGPASGPVLGEWYWVIPDQAFDPKKEAKLSAEQREINAERRKEWLGCAIKIGSNYVEIRSPEKVQSQSYKRVLLANFWTELRHEPNADGIIRKNIGAAQQESARLLGEVKELTQRLGMAPMEAQRTEASDSSNSLMVLSGTHDVKAYGRDLVLAKETQLPELFKAIKEANEELTRWMKAPSMPMIAQLETMKGSVADIDDRIFSVGLYAGLTEESVQCCEGAPAAATERLHVMQRMAFMDEECLANYRHGGMEFKDIGEFDKFMADPVNRDRILPFPRTLVAMRVRRNTKDRDSFGNMGQAIVNMRLEQADKFTFLYIRNGEQVWRLSCEMDFGELIFPDRSVYDPSEAKMFKMFGHSIDKFMSVEEYEVRKAEYDLNEKQSREWLKEFKRTNPGENSWGKNPYDQYWHRDFRPSEWQPMNDTSVYFDEAMETITKKIKEYNRVALIIQGLFDRSLVLHPHPPVKTWTADGFDKAVKLVYDGSDIIPFGEAPDFEAYRARCNATMAVGSMTVGQDDFWARKEAVKEGARRDNDWRDKSDYRPERFRPYGNPGPGYIARVVKFSKVRGATFTWTREKRSGDRYWDKTVDCTLTVPVAELFNIDAYKLGDYKQFFADSRTRQHYLKWAPLLMAAEEHVFAASGGKP